MPRTIDVKTSPLIYWLRYLLLSIANWVRPKLFKWLYRHLIRGCIWHEIDVVRNKTKYEEYLSCSGIYDILHTYTYLYNFCSYKNTKFRQSIDSNSDMFYYVIVSKSKQRQHHITIVTVYHWKDIEYPQNL